MDKMGSDKNKGNFARDKYSNDEVNRKISEIKEQTSAIIHNVAKVMVGKEELVEYLLVALLSGGHILLEDVPGTGKTKLAKALAASLAVDCARIQFTPDLLPGDITGLNVYNRKENEFVLRKGPVFTNILLADEINRATPRTQAGLLECMEEGQVTIDGECYVLADPFMVIATQNPVETAGTYPLPEAQLDRFMMKLSAGLPGPAEEVAILERFMTGDPMAELEPVAGREEIGRIRERARQVFVHPVLLQYLADIAGATRIREDIIMGVSPRGTLALMKGIKVYALLQGRHYCIPDDVKKLAIPVLAHRLILNYGYQNRQEAEKRMAGILTQIPAPTEEFANSIPAGNV